MGKKDKRNEKRLKGRLYIPNPEVAKNTGD